VRTTFDDDGDDSNDDDGEYLLEVENQFGDVTNTSFSCY